MALLIIGVLVGAVILVAALKAALGPDKKQRRGHDASGASAFDSEGYRSKNFDGSSNDTGGDGGGGGD